MPLTCVHFCFQTENPFRRTIQYAISLGGDTDTIANMAGAIAGAYYGYGSISENLQKHCEATRQFIEYADKLHKIAVAK
jgi:poly(ADP-ribose) glycohydrolase ARH3